MVRDRVTRPRAQSLEFQPGIPFSELESEIKWIPVGTSSSLPRYTIRPHRYIPHRIYTIHDASHLSFHLSPLSSSFLLFFFPFFLLFYIFCCWCFTQKLFFNSRAFWEFSLLPQPTRIQSFCRLVSFSPFISHLFSLYFAVTVRKFSRIPWLLNDWGRRWGGWTGFVGEILGFER